MPNLRVNWHQLKDQQLETVTGAYFTVVRVTSQYVTVQPARGRRTYALSIPDELEPGVTIYYGHRFLPPPAELVHLGVRPILLSYAWGILRAVVIDGLGLQPVLKVALKDFGGFWRITEMPDMDEAYLEEGLGDPGMQLHTPVSKGNLWGQYQIGLSVGSVRGEFREFGGEQILVFGYEGMDEMEPGSGGGWMRLMDKETLEGEFIGSLGHFTAKRSQLTAIPVKTKKQR